MFDRPLVRGTITPEGGVVEVRRPGSDEVERLEIRKARTKSGKEVSKVVETMAKAAANGATQRDAGPAADKPAGEKPSTRAGKEISDQTRRVAELYNQGVSVSDIMEQLEMARSTVHRHIKQARDVGLITKWRHPALVAAGGQSEQSGVDPSAVEDLRRELGECRKELEVARKELEAVVSGLAELTRRIEALESRAVAVMAPAPVVTVPGDGETVQRLLRLLELAMTDERRRIA